MNPDFEVREHFLILLLKELSRQLSGRPFAVKGGICLRFFYQSPRLSEDMDLDIAQVVFSTLSKIVEKTLNSNSFNSDLENRGQKILKWTASKQTPTTQRWKIALLINNRSLSTKLEFSRRKEKIPFSAGIPDGNLLSHYKIITFATQHYSLEEMIKQKCTALASPTRKAGRDLFDLYHLISRKAEEKISLGTTTIAEAIKKCEAINQVAFKNEVCPFLPDEMSSFFKATHNYEMFHDRVESYLKGLLKE